MSTPRSLKSNLLTKAAILAACACVLAMAMASSAAQAQPPAPWWGLSTGSRPSVIPPKGIGQIFVSAENLGNAPTSGKVTITDQLPPGYTVLGVKAKAGGSAGFDRGPLHCTPSPLICTFEKYEEENEKGEKETIIQSLPPFEVIEMLITVQLSGAAKSGAPNTATVSGGGAPSTVSTSHPIQIGSDLKFGIDDYTLIPEEEGGLIDTQAGSHPFQLTSVVTLNSQASDKEGHPRTVALTKTSSPTFRRAWSATPRRLPSAPTRSSPRT